MRSKLLFVLATAMLGGCQATQTRDNATPSTAPSSSRITFAGGDGSTIEKAVVIVGANEMTGVSAEYDWIERHYPGYTRKNQAVASENGKMFDLLEIEVSGKKKTLYFDITGFFGKMK
ncbi:MAG: adenosylhomocysteinase [Gammaproteobacteria bacterium]|nr:MAG: adenosylhomocysteinase [Gammaproteobacteria bacterium]